MVSEIQEVMARVVRNTRVKDSSYIADMDEWLAEAMGIMHTQFTLIPHEEDIVINFHKGKLPQGLEYIEAIALGGRRLKRKNGIRPPDRRHHGYHDHIGSTNGFEFLPQMYSAPPQNNPQENSFLYTQDLTPGPRLPEHEEHWYDEDVAGYITTSLERGRLTVYARKVPTDDLGLPLIPNNEHYKQALYWYVRGMMIGAGYDDKVFRFNDIMLEHDPKGHFWIHAEKAIGQIIYPDLNTMECKMNANLRLIKDEHFFHKFFTTLREERRYGYDLYWEGLSPQGARTFPRPPQGNPQNGENWNGVEW